MSKSCPGRSETDKYYNEAYTILKEQKRWGKENTKI